MPGSLHSVHHRFRTWLTPSQQRGVRLLASASVVSVVGVSVTGLWQFFAHRSNPGWYDDELGTGASAPSAPSEGMAELHGIFAFVVAAVALVGGAWFAYKVPYDVPWPAAIALAVAVVGPVPGSVIRFSLVKCETGSSGKQDGATSRCSTPTSSSSSPTGSSWGHSRSGSGRSVRP